METRARMEDPFAEDEGDSMMHRQGDRMHHQGDRMMHHQGDRMMHHQGDLRNTIQRQRCVHRPLRDSSMRGFFRFFFSCYLLSRKKPIRISRYFE
jgi:hypothetical protein